MDHKYKYEISLGLKFLPQFSKSKTLETYTFLQNWVRTVDLLKLIIPESWICIF